MTQQDVFFTISIVGGPQEVSLGLRLRPSDRPTEGMRVNLQTGQSRLTQWWQQRVLLSSEETTPGIPRPAPTALRRWLERHALWIGVMGSLSCALSLYFWSLVWRS